MHHPMLIGRVANDVSRERVDGAPAYAPVNSPVTRGRRASVLRGLRAANGRVRLRPRLS